MRRLLATAAVLAGLLLGSLTTPTAAAAPAPTWHRILNDNFSWTLPNGAWSDCNHNADTRQAYCATLPSWASRNWWAYPTGWPDTAAQRNYPVSGFYDPHSTLWVSGGALHIKLWRSSKDDRIRSAAVVPRAAMGLTYGRYEERFRVSAASNHGTGYKSAHLLWPDNNADQCSEIDYPELEWDTAITAFDHPSAPASNPSDCGVQQSYDTGATWTQWHDTTLIWLPGRVQFWLDGRLIGQSTKSPTDAMSWIIQNESALNGEQAPRGSWAQMDIDYARVWSWS